MENATEKSVGSTYEQIMRPRDQKRWLASELKPMKDKIVASIQGNHEHRSGKEVDSDMMYDVMSKLDLEHLYRENSGFVKINVGEKSHDRQFSYSFAMFHGASKFKTRIMGYAIDGIDALITGHDHQGQSYFPAKIVVDSKNETVKMRGFTRLVVTPFLKFGGYGAKAMYEPQDHTKIPILQLSGTKKEVRVIWT